MPRLRAKRDSRCICVGSASPGEAPPGSAPTSCHRLRVRSQNTVRVAQGGDVVGGEDPALAERCQGGDRARATDAMAQLQELRRPFDVGQRSLPELQVELGILAGRDPLPFDAGLHPPDVGHVRLGEGTTPDEGLDDRHEPRAEITVAGHDARPHQGLALPGLCPALEVRVVAVRAAREAALAAFGPKAQIERHDPLRRAWDRAPGGARPRPRPLPAASSPSCTKSTSRSLAYDISAPPRSSHAHHAERHIGARRAPSAPSKHGLGDAGECRPRGPHVVEVEDVARARPEPAGPGAPARAAPGARRRRPTAGAVRRSPSRGRRSGWRPGRRRRPGW